MASPWSHEAQNKTTKQQKKVAPFEVALYGHSRFLDYIKFAQSFPRLLLGSGSPSAWPFTWLWKGMEPDSVGSVGRWQCRIWHLLSSRDTTTDYLIWSETDQSNTSWRRPPLSTTSSSSSSVVGLPFAETVCVVVCRLKDDNDPVSGDYWIFIIHFATSAMLLVRLRIVCPNNKNSNSQRPTRILPVPRERLN